ncbi:ATP-binding protein [Mariniblastus fucicola]|uniref:Histidine kinase-, DNA gyrase B-, and HSP90-like ATPase n=1 Tax=Mariniblastus fucicola TaxID=980251 RepID=A0A5B9PIT4_9BACT|nr:ATP-binding protein [Mariniblastus fucicola]QEG25150.1 hypothetical protein MFFC18_50740 [Mariniblastus fucicola]
MPFKITARTILQLGAELISSDGIAFYELIKNAFDAGSKKVHVDVLMRIPIEIVQEIADSYEELEFENEDLAESEQAQVNGWLSASKALARKHLISSSPLAKDWLATIDSIFDCDELMEAFYDANAITFSDYGDGMSLDDLDRYYLTVGTPHRHNQRKEAEDGENEGESNGVILGEKGIGRLSAMRLGRQLSVKTATEEDAFWNHLDIDWDDFGEEIGKLVGEVHVEPEEGEEITKEEDRGTTIRVSCLNENWSSTKLQEIANSDIARLLDPFTKKKRISVFLRFNGRKVVIPKISEILLDRAHAILDAEFQIVENEKGEPDVCLSGNVQYLVSSATGAKLRNRVNPFEKSYVDLMGIFENEDDVDLDTCISLGPFSIKCYWFNRRLIKKITINEETLDLKKIIRQWSGGLALYRDGFRVPPYGSGDDDWLDLDRGALASQGYKVNRAQLIGKVDITGTDNPHLVDQTNREGLRNSRQTRALVLLCKNVLEVELRGYLKDVDDEIREEEKISFGDLSEQLDEVESKINNSLDDLAAVHDQNVELGLAKVEKRLRSAYRTVVNVVDEMQGVVEATEDEKSKLLHLAALGLSVEKLAHELNRTTRHALEGVLKLL